MVHINLQRNSQPSIYPFLPTIKHSWAWDYGRTGKYFKDKKSHYVEKDQWLIFEDTHAPIIDQETFDNVQRIRGQVRRYPDGWGEAHPLTGLMYCADCGGKMYVKSVSGNWKC